MSAVQRLIEPQNCQGNRQAGINKTWHCWSLVAVGTGNRNPGPLFTSGSFPSCFPPFSAQLKKMPVSTAVGQLLLVPCPHLLALTIAGATDGIIQQIPVAPQLSAKGVLSTYKQDRAEVPWSSCPQEQPSANDDDSCVPLAF